ncbi:MAG TPA: hypothetical protein VL326_10730, partial [Kofleriaceae bacterium]|nr:hypothetical protein [Kofleriaceae bacterium]
MRSRRAWIYVLSVLALLVPAGGIAYLGAFAYADDRGAVTEQNERQQKVAQAIAERIATQVDAAFAEIELALSRKDVPHGPLSAPLAHYWFWIDPEGHMRVPRAPAPAVFEGAAYERVPCSGRLEDCVRDSTTRQVRLAKLQAASRAEACRGDACVDKWQDARRQYLALAMFDDTGPQALLGLARIYARTGDANAVQGALSDLEQRYGDRVVDELPVALVVATMRAETPQQILEIAEQVASGKFDVHPIVALGVIERLRAKVAGDLPNELAQRRAALDEQMVAIRTEARMADGLADDIPDVIRDAAPTWHGRAAIHEANRTLIYKKRGDGSVVGIAVDASMLEHAADHHPDDDVAVNVRPLVLQAGRMPPKEEWHSLATAQISELPHLSLYLVNPASDDDPLDVVIRNRSRRHVAYTSALAIALGLGLLATIRGAARARELAQLKSDFVSTVSHELRTPLTS